MAGMGLDDGTLHHARKREGCCMPKMHLSAFWSGRFWNFRDQRSFQVCKSPPCHLRKEAWFCDLSQCKKKIPPVSPRAFFSWLPFLLWSKDFQTFPKLLIPLSTPAGPAFLGAAVRSCHSLAEHLSVAQGLTQATSPGELQPISAGKGDTWPDSWESSFGWLYWARGMPIKSSSWCFP